MKMNRVLGLVVCLVGFGVCTGCSRTETQTEASVGDATWAPVAMDIALQEHAEQLQLAVEARDALGSRLKSELVAAMQSEGPSGAVGICSAIAPSLSEQVGEEFGVRIGRSSHKLRNENNTAPIWMQTVIDAMDEDPVVFVSSTGEIGAAYPIRIEAACLLCHGEIDSILPVVAERIAEHYPNDQATGFAMDDLRGWFWVEVPAQ